MPMTHDDIGDDLELDRSEPGDEVDPPPPATPRWLAVLLASVVAVALLLAGGALAVIAGIGQDDSPAATPPADDSVDVGFMRDMIRHHLQAVEMAGWTRDHSTDPAVRLIAFDIETSQLTQIGQMQGILLSWGRSQVSDSAPMAWMSADSMAGMDHGAESTATPSAAPTGEAGRLMPGMATEAELAEMKTLSGTELDIRFLQLMMRHHNGGLPMASYAAENATTKPVRGLAAGMAKTQTAEIVTLERMLRERGGVPLPN